MVSPQLPMEPVTLLPHRSPMLFVKRLLERCGDRAVAEAVIPETGICTDSETLFVELLIELIAQTAAMANGYDLLKEGKEQGGGMLVGIDSFTVDTMPEPGARVEIKIEKTFEFGAMKMIHGEILSENTRYCSGDIKVWEYSGKDA